MPGSQYDGPVEFEAGDFDANESDDVSWVADDDAGPGEPDDAGPSDAGRLDARAPSDSGTRTDSGASGPTVIDRTFRVLHWNIAGGKENDCQTAGITRAVRRYVQENNVDFVGLNEVCPSQFQSIQDALRSQWGLGARAEFAAYVGDQGGRIVGNGIYSRFGMQNVTKLMVGQDQYGDRNLICGQVPDLPHVRFCGVHLTPADATARTQMGRVLDRIEQWWTERSDTVILAGDLNLNADDPGLNPVYTAAVNTRNNGDNRGHYHELDDADPMNCIGYGERSHAGTGGPCGTGGKIDFIFARENRIINNEYAGDTFTVPTDCTGACSDHRAVYGRVHVRIVKD